MSREPKFRVGDRVYHAGLEMSGTVESVINANDEVDFRAQGFRYEVTFGKGRELWSVLEVNLVPK